MLRKPDPHDSTSDLMTQENLQNCQLCESLNKASYDSHTL